MALCVSVQVTHPSLDEDRKLPLGSMCLVRFVKGKNKWTDQDTVCLKKFASQVQSLLLSHHERTFLQPRARLQAAFVGSFIQDDLGSDSPMLKPAVYNSTLDSISAPSPAMSAVRTVQQTAYIHHYVSHAFDKTISRMAELVEADGMALLDLREFAKSADIRLDAVNRGMERKRNQRGAPDLRSGSESTSPGFAPAPFKHKLRPVRVLGVSPGGTVDSLVEMLANQDYLEAIEEALKTCRANSVAAGLASAVKSALPSTSRSTIVLPIFDHLGHPALVVVASSSRRAAFASTDRNFLQQAGHLCLTAIVKDQAIAGEKVKLAFVAQISHELRTPMHGLTGQVELIREMYSNTEEAAELDPVLKVADVCLNSLAAIMDDSLEFAKLSNEADSALSAVSGSHGQFDLVDVSEFTANVTKAAWVRRMRLASSSAEDSNESREKGTVEVILEFRPQEDGWQALVNTSELRRIIANIVSNAYEFTQNGWVRITLDTEPNSDDQNRRFLVLTVSDSGVGIPEPFLTSGDIWLPFRQADSFSPGSGLGLSIVRELLNRAGGAVNITSSFGEGTNVFASIPIEFEPGPRTPSDIQVFSDDLGLLKRVAKQRWSSRKGHVADGTSVNVETTLAMVPEGETAARPVSLIAPSSVPVPAASKPADPATLLTLAANSSSTSRSQSRSGIIRPLSILVAEDNAIARNILARLLQKHGFSFVAVEDGQKAVDHFQQHGDQIDLTLMDIQMPVKDGLEASHDIRKIEKERGWRRHRIVALTGLSNSEDVSLALGDTGPMDAWVVKGGTSLRDLTEEMRRMQDMLARTAGAPSQREDVHSKGQTEMEPAVAAIEALNI